MRPSVEIRSILVDRSPAGVNRSLALHLIQRETQYPLGRWVGRGYSAFGVLVDDALRHGLEEHPVLLFRVPQGFLRPSTLTDILDYGHEVLRLIRFIVYQRDCQIDPDSPAAFSDDQLLLGVVPYLTSQHLYPSFEVILELLQRDQVKDAYLGKLLAGISGDAAELTVVPEPGAVQPDLNHSDGGLIEGRPEPLFALAPLFLGPLALGDVLRCAFRTHQFPGFVPERPRVYGKPYHAPVLASRLHLEARHNALLGQQARELETRVRTHVYLPPDVGHDCR